MESMDQCRRLKVREKARKLMFFVMSLRLSDHKVLRDIIMRVLMGVPNYQLTTNFSANCQLTTIFLAYCQLTTNFSYLLTFIIS